ncbi:MULTISPECIES: hypothetical protein [unclassified Phaeobacter]|uniref:hypothetical protein n=1 Tax=unclassified Phaeobacter TaxID=2621772 RepID=UPI003A8C3FC5
MNDEPAPTYTGPTNVSFKDNSIHIDGYAEGKRVALLDTKPAKRLAALRIHQQRLEQCEAAMQEVLRLPSDLENARYSAIIGAVAQYFSCFGKNNVYAPLQPDRVFKGMEDAKECFRYWKAIRDTHVIHEEDTLSFGQTGLVLGHDDEVIDILSLKMVAQVFDEEHLNLLYKLLVHTIAHVESEIDRSLTFLFADAEAMGKEKRSSLRDLVYTVPKPKDLL